MMTNLQHGCRSALRLSRRNPGYVGLIVAILGLGIGATTAALSVASSVLFSPLPVADESRLVLITKTLSAGSTLTPFSYAEIAAWRDASCTLESVAGVDTTVMAVVGAIPRSRHDRHRGDRHGRFLRNDGLTADLRSVADGR